MLRTRLNPPRDVFPIDPWAMKSLRFTPEFVPQAETAFALANGYLGLRGSFSEDRPVREPGTYLNGFHELRPIVYGEHAYGFPQVGQTMLNCPDGKVIKLYVDDEPFDLETAEVSSFRRKLDMKAGIYLRDVTWSTPAGKRIRLRTTRLVSFDHRHLAMIHFQLLAENADAEFIVSSELINRQPLPVDTSDPRMGEGFIGRVLHPTGTEGDSLRAVFSYCTQGSGLALGCGMDHAVDTGCVYDVDASRSDDLASVVFKIRGQAGRPIRITKYLSYHYSDKADAQEIRSQTAWTLERALEHGFAQVLAQQRTYMQGFWERADVEV